MSTFVPLAIPPRLNLDERDYLLAVLMEEAGEVVHAAGKCLRFGIDANHVPEYGVNRTALSRELGELFAVAETLGIDWDAFMDARLRKIPRVWSARALYPKVSS